MPSARPERSIKDANEAKAARRAEIERRCALFDPPVPPNILNHMDSFQAAIQISTPLTDAAWDVLKPRLLSQRASAEKREQEQVQQNEILQSELKQRRYQESQKETKELLDRQWDSVQASIRDRLGILADALIDERWFGGRAVSKESSPKFAADVLLTVRQRFYDTIAREREATDQAGRSMYDDTPDGSQGPALILENMKWLFDTKIKPITEHFQKELFLCNGCDDNFKMYGFEGVIQHYAAKHTTSLSMGSIVVYWRAEWPDEPPFNPEPSVSKSAYYKVPSPAAGGSNLYNCMDQPAYDSTGSYAAAHEADPMPTSDAISAALSTAPYYSTQAAPPQSTAYTQSYGQVYSSTPASAVMTNGTNNGFVRVSASGQLPQWQGSHTMVGPAQGVGGQDFSPLYSGNQYQSTFSPNGTGPGAPYGSQIPHRAAAAHPPHFDPTRNSAAQLTEGYQQQMDEMAKQARYVWFSTSSIKDLPASVRIYVVIHHVAARFSEKFSTVPSLAMFLDGIDNNSQMRPVRSLNGLACKTCVTQHNAPNHQAQPPTGDRRLYTLPHLLNHFRVVHLEGAQVFANPHPGPGGPQHDWTRDMIELPETRLIADLVHSSGMDDNKLELIAWAFPHVFPSPLPKLGVLRSSGPVPNTREVFNVYPSAASIHGQTTSSTSSKGRVDAPSYNRPSSAFRPTSRLSRASEPPGEDEYDPHKPAYQSRNDITSTGIVNVGDLRGYPSDRARERWEWHEPHHDRQLPESADLSKLIYSATHPQSVHESEKPSEHRHDQQSHLHSTLASRQAFQPEASAAYERASYGEYDNRHPAQDDIYRNGQVTEYRNSEGYVVASSQGKARSPSMNTGLRAAEQFLQHFGHASQLEDYNKPKSFEQHRKPSPVDQWSEATALRNEENARQFRPDSSKQLNFRTARVASEMSPNTAMRAPGPESRSDHNTSPMHSQGSEMHQLPNYRRSASNTFTQLNESAMNGRRSRTYVDYAPPQRTMMQASNDYGDERPESSNDGVRVSQAYHHRDRPRSPLPVAMDTRYYPQGSPVEDLQTQAVYRIRSPLPQQETRIQGTFYERPGYDDYDRVEDHPYVLDSPNWYRQRIEYVPIRAGNQSPPDSGRYIIAQPAVSRGRAEYVRLDEPYEQGAVFERDGRLYRADPRTYQTPLTRGNAGSTLNYTY